MCLRNCETKSRVNSRLTVHSVQSNQIFYIYLTIRHTWKILYYDSPATYTQRVCLCRTYHVSSFKEERDKSALFLTLAVQHHTVMGLLKIYLFLKHAVNR